MAKDGIMAKLMTRDIRRNFLQYISMIVITMLAVNLFCGFISNTLKIDKRTNNYFNQANLTDITVQFSTISISDYEFFNDLKLSGEISDFESRFYTAGSVGNNSGKIFAGSNSISAPIVNEGEQGVLLDVNMKKSYNIGDFIDIEISGYPVMTFTVTGFMYFAEVSTHTYSPIYIDENIFSQAISEKTGLPIIPALLYNQILIKTQNSAAVMENINEHYSAASSGFILTYGRESIESVAAMEGERTTSLRMIYVFPVIFLLVSILVILTTVSALILRERTNIGTLKALGISNKRIMMHYATFGAILCFIGGVIGAVTAPFIVPNVLGIKYNLVYSIPNVGGIVFSPLWSLLAIATVSLLSLVIGIMVCRSVIKEKPAQCMRPALPKHGVLFKLSTSKSENKTQKNKGNLPLKMAFRNIVIKPSRALMIIVGVMGCVALLVCSFGIGDTIDNSVNLELGKQFYYDVNAVYSEAGANDFVELMSELKTDGIIKEYEAYKTFYMTASNKGTVKTLKIFAIEENSHFTSINPKSGALISKTTADEMNVRSGDILDIATGTSSFQIKITGIIETSITNGIFISSNDLDSYYHTLGMWIETDESELLVGLLKSHGINDVYSMEERHETVTKMISSISIIKLTMMIFSIALSLVVLYNLSLLNIKERNRDIATLKVLGFSNVQVSLSLFYEIMLLVLLGTVFGLFLGFPLLYLVLSINKIEVMAFIFHIKPISYVLAALISLFAATSINLVFGLLIKKVKMLDSLKSIE